MKALKIIRSIFVWLMVALAVFMMIFTIVSVSTFDRADRSLFGYKAFIVLSDSMSKTDFKAGDLVLVKAVDPSTLKEGDIIAYTSQNSSNYGENRALSPTVQQRTPMMKPSLPIRMCWVNTAAVSRRWVHSFSF